MLFEFYMSFCSGYSSHRDWVKMCNNVDDNDSLSEDDQKKVYDENSSRFVGWLLWHICSIGSNGRKQMFFVTFIAHYYGLSRDGIDVLAKYGYGVTMDMFDNMRKSATVKCEDTTRYNNT